MAHSFLIDRHDKTPVYQQLANAIRFAIQTHKLHAGDALPSLRSVAKTNGVALNTVVKAYRILEERALITSTDRKGFVVASQAQSAESVSAEPKAKKQVAKAPEAGARYAARGVSSAKADVHAVVDQLDRGVFPGAFCKITEDFLGGDPDKCNITHSDGSGTKALLAYLHWKETGDASVFRGIAQDSIVMNIDDLLCVGCTGHVLLSSTINRNARNIPGEILSELIQGTEAVLENLRNWGFEIHSGGGETADVGDLTPTLTVDSCATAIMRKRDVITGNEIRPGLAIIGMASYGKASYENTVNSGIGSNGLTSARHDMLKPVYRKKYPETVDPKTKKELVYCGPYKLQDPLPGSELKVGDALLSPTRTYAPVINQLLHELRPAIKGIVHCSGGGQTKCLRFGKNVHFIKDQLLPIPPIFKAIQKASGTKWREMYQVYNMGHRMEIYCPKPAVDDILACLASFSIDAAQIGETVPSEKKGQNHLTLSHGKKRLAY